MTDPIQDLRQAARGGAPSNPLEMPRYFQNLVADFVGLSKASDTLDAGATNLDPPALGSLSGSMFGSLAGGAGDLTEGQSGRSANKLLVALGNTGVDLANRLDKAKKAYEAQEASGVSQSGTINGKGHR